MVADWGAGRQGSAVGRVAVEIASIVFGGKGIRQVTAAARHHLPRLADETGGIGRRTVTSRRGATSHAVQQRHEPGTQTHERLFTLPRRARATSDWADLTRRLKRHHGIDQRVASMRLHEIKSAVGLGGADNVVFDLTGNVYHPVTQEWIGSLTEGGSRGVR